MQTIDNEFVAGWDMDDTLVMWDNPTVDGPGKVKVPFAGGFVYLTPHNYHIQLLKLHKERGYFNIGWSANGRQHVVNVITALGVEDCIDLAMSKLTKHFDDSTGAIIGPRIYIDDLTKPKPEPVWGQIVTTVTDIPYKPFGGTSG
jgi:hypothetical protein